MNTDPINSTCGEIGAIILAAGLSKRMGAAKMLLPWGEGTVISAVVKALIGAGVKEIIVVSGGIIDQIREALRRYQVNVVFNPEYQNEEMIDSLRVGLKSLSEDVQAALIVLGDQPGIEIDVIEKLVTKYRGLNSSLIVPSYNMRRGHPWLVDRSLFTHLLNITPPETMRTFLERFKNEIVYVEVETPSVIQDIDTPEDYQENHADK